MAECMDDLSDFDTDQCCIGDELVSKFNSAASFLPQIASNLDSSVLLQLYAFYKQASIGSCNIPKPSWFRTQDKMKWEAWSSLKDMPKEIAMEKYIATISKIDSTWLSESTSQEKSKSWAAVSTFTLPDTITNETEKTIFDYCKEGNIAQFSLLLKNTERNILDTQGLGLIHWAADRGHLAIIKLLLINGHDINLIDGDGQTALHYAVSCGHRDCVEYLLEMDIDCNVKDDDGTLAVELTDDDELKKMLRKGHYDE